jgi:hypothetical protein
VPYQEASIDLNLVSLKLVCMLHFVHCHPSNLAFLRGTRRAIAFFMFITIIMMTNYKIDIVSVNFVEVFDVPRSNFVCSYFELQYLPKGIHSYYELQ